MRKTAIIFILSLIFATFLPMSAMSQNETGNSLIVKEIADESSPYFYPNIFSRYQLGDTTLTLADYQHLYYGYIHQLDYKPFDVVSEKDSVDIVMERMSGPNDADYRKMLDYTKKVLEKEPFNLRDLNMEAYLYSVLGDTLNAIKSNYKLEMTLAAIKSSGDGLTELTPWHVISHEHATDVLDYMGVRYQRRLIISRNVENFPLVVKDGDVKSYYFDIGRIYLRRPDYQLDERRKMEFNPFYNPRSELYLKPRGK